MDYMTGVTLRLMVPTLQLCCNNEWISKNTMGRASVEVTVMRCQ